MSSTNLSVIENTLKGIESQLSRLNHNIEKQFSEKEKARRSAKKVLDGDKVVKYLYELREKYPEFTDDQYAALISVKEFD